MIRVYIWDNDIHSGHASLSTDRYYRSFHPATAAGVRLADAAPLIGNVAYSPAWVRSLDDDANEHERLNHCIDIISQHEGVLDQYIENNLESDFKSYHLHTSNCSTVVARLLITSYYNNLRHHGKFEDMMWKMKSGHLLFEHKNNSHNSRYFESAWDIFEEHSSALLRSGRLGPVTFSAGLVDVWRRFVVWTPGDISRMANKMKALIRDHGA